jgi:hypothetical protein
MFLLEFLNRISFLSLLIWSFYFIAVLCALILTNYASPMTRKYRKSLIAVGVSSIILGSLSWSSPYFMSKVNPSQSRLVPIDALVTTQWEEPVSNPDTDLPADEISWTKSLPYHFKYKVQFPESFRQAVAAEGSNLSYLDGAGNLRGFNAYTGLNHWHIPLRAVHVLAQLMADHKLYLLDDTHANLKVSCIDLVNPSLLWQRTIPNSKEGALSYDPDSQSIIVTAGNGGIWSLKAKNGEIFWKRPEIFSRVRAVVSPKHLVVFEPVIANHAGSWYFLDLQNGKTLQKSPHVYSEIQSFFVEPANASPSFLAEVDSENFFYLNHTDLSQLWNFRAQGKIKIAKFVDPERILFLYESGLLELRNAHDNSLIYQKKLADVTESWLRLNQDLSFLTIPSTNDDGNPGVSLF